MFSRKAKIVMGVAVILVVIYLLLPFALIPVIISGERGRADFSQAILDVAYSPILQRLSVNNPYKSRLIKYGKSICAEHPNRCVIGNN